MEGSSGNHHHQNPTPPLPDNQPPLRRLIEGNHQFLYDSLPDNPYSIGSLESSFGALSLNNGRDYSHDRYHQYSPLQVAGIGRDVGYQLFDYNGGGFTRNQGNLNAHDVGEFSGNNFTDHDYNQISYLINNRSPNLINQNLHQWGGGGGGSLGSVNPNNLYCWNNQTYGGIDSQRFLLQQRSRQQQQQERYGRVLINNRPPCSNGYSSSTAAGISIPDDGGIVHQISGSRRVNGNNRRNLVSNNEINLLESDLEAFNLLELRGKVMSWVKDQYGCRLLQLKLNEPKKEEIEMIFNEVISSVVQLITHPFANYLIQKLAEVCSEEQRTRLVSTLCETDYQLVRICADAHGTRAVQKLLEHLNTHQQISMVTSSLSAEVVSLSKDMNGYHVINNCLKLFPPEENEYIVNELVDDCYGLATDKCGCCVLQTCVDYSQGQARERVFSEIVVNAFHLADDRYGNYVVQHVLALRITHVTSNIIKQLEGRFVGLSSSKYGSNVVEKCLLECMDQDQVVWIVCEILSSPNVSILLSDPYGNYVIQRALQVSKGALFDAIVDLVQANYPSMRSNLYGKKILAWLEKRRIKFNQPFHHEADHMRRRRSIK